jgi:hypothetical protein
MTSKNVGEGIAPKKKFLLMKLPTGMVAPPWVNPHLMWYIRYKNRLSGSTYPRDEEKINNKVTKASVSDMCHEILNRRTPTKIGTVGDLTNVINGPKFSVDRWRGLHSMGVGKSPVPIGKASRPWHNIALLCMYVITSWLLINRLLLKIIVYVSFIGAFLASHSRPTTNQFGEFDFSQRYSE